MASLLYNQFKADVGQGKYAWQTSSVGIKATLVSGYVPAASHLYASAISGYELSGGGFSGLYSGSIRLALVSTFVSTNQGLLVGSAGRAEFGASATTWSAISAGMASAVVLLCESAVGVTNNGNALLVAYIDTGGFPVTTNGGDRLGLAA